MTFFIPAVIPATALALALAPAPAAAEDFHQSRFLVRLDPAADRALREDGAAVPSLEALDVRFGVVDHSPLFPEGAGRADPEAFQSLGLARTWVFQLGAPAQDMLGVAEAYASCPVVEHSSPDFVYQTDKTPNDTRWNDQWNLRKVNCPAAWNILTDTTGTVIAVIDTGSDLDHPDFQDNRWKNPGETGGNGIDDDGNGYVDDLFGYDFANNDSRPDDDNGHGSHTSGTAGAVGDNAKGIAGVCWVAEVMSLKALDSFGAGFLSDVAEAITYATDNGALVVNMSLGGPDDATLRNAVAYAGRKDVLQVAAAGNDGTTGKSYPAAYDEVMGIISTDDRDRRSGFSTHGKWCSMAAPGENILSLWNDGGLATLSGTSMASPHVAGVATLVRTVNPDLDRYQVQQVLEQSSVDLGNKGFDSDFGFGRLDAERAVKMADALHGSRTRVSDGGSVDFTLHYKDAANQIYLMLPTRNGHLPGIDLSVIDPNEVRVLPVNTDNFLQNFVLTHPFNGIFFNFIGTLDASGDGTATFNVPKHFWIDETFHFAYLTFDPADLTKVQWISTAVKVKVVD